MKKFILTLLLGTVTAIANGQGSTGPSQTTSPPQTTQNPTSEAARFPTRDYGRNQPGDIIMEKGPFERENPNDIRRRVIYNNARMMYRKPSDAERKLLEVDPALVGGYKSFLAQSRTGLIRLLPNYECAADTRVINASDNCRAYTMPGAGATYSFRAETYRITRLGDITYFDENNFKVGGKLSLAIIANLGNTEIESLTVNSAGVKDLRQFAPPTEVDQIAKQYAKIENGYTSNGIRFGKTAKIVENSTYILRSVAYKSKYLTTIGGNLTYNEFEFDNRSDVLVALRVVRKNDDGSLIVLWKELERKESPKIKTKKDFDGKRINAKSKSFQK